MRNVGTLACVLWLVPAGAIAAPMAQLTAREHVVFEPARGETLHIPFRLKASARVRMSLHTADGERIRELGTDKVLSAGEHRYEWDGRDADERLVPDEVYVPVMHVAVEGGETIVVDPRASSGGEAIDDIPFTLTSDYDVRYQLAEPARVLIRAGIHGGAMLRALSDWEPHDAGVNVARWDGYDEDGADQFVTHPDSRILVVGYALPDHSIITHGNEALSYPEYRETLGWEDPELDLGEAPLERNGRRISRHYRMPRAADRDPEIGLELIGDAPRTPAGEILVSEPVSFRVTVAEKDRWILGRHLFEVAFFRDYEFVAEEEHGYLPLTWRWDPAVAEPGRYVITVNVSTFGGQVGVASVPVRVVPK